MDGLVGGPDPPPLNPALKVGRPTRAAIIGSYRARSTLSKDDARAAARSAYFADACVACTRLARAQINSSPQVCVCLSAAAAAAADTAAYGHVVCPRRRRS